VDVDRDEMTLRLVEEIEGFALENSDTGTTFVNHPLMVAASVRDSGFNTYDSDEGDGDD
jgi:hypothetical protein